MAMTFGSSQFDSSNLEFQGSHALLQCLMLECMFGIIMNALKTYQTETFHNTCDISQASYVYSIEGKHTNKSVNRFIGT